MTIVLCYLDFTTNYSRAKGWVFARCDLRFINRKGVNFCLSLLVGYYWLCSSRIASGTRIVPMLVQSCLNAFLAAIVEVKDSLRASPRVLLRCCFSSRPTSRSSPAPVPLGSTLSSLGPRAARPASRLFFRAHVPFVFFSIYIYCGDRARRAYPSFCYIATSLCLYIIGAMFAVLFVLLENFTPVRRLT